MDTQANHDTLAGQLLAELLAAGFWLELGADSAGVQLLGVHRQDPRRRFCVVRDSLLQALHAAQVRLSGREPAKVCPGCQEMLPLARFGPDKNRPDGRNRRCRACEHARTSKYQRPP